MTHVWTVEKLLALAPERLEILRQNAVRVDDTALVDLCAEIQMSRRQKAPTTAGQSIDPVIGFHFVCDSDYEVTLLPDGRFWSGVWVVNQAHCDPAVSLKAYVALHKSKREASYRQGTIIDWRLEQRTKGTREMGVSFLLSPLPEPISWHGTGSGEKGYRRSSSS